MAEEQPDPSPSPDNSNRSNARPPLVTQQAPDPSGGGTDPSSAQILAAIEQLRAKISAPPDMPDPFRGLAQFASSGFFFILLGLGLLFIAAYGLGVVHTSFSFVLIVLGVAILLYGTGTQGMARFETDENSAKYNVALAGGAGVLAFCVAFGIVEYYEKMQMAFNLQTKYVIAVLKPKKDGSSTFDNYFPIFDIEGNPVPAMKNGDNIFVFVPFRQAVGDVRQRVTYTLKHTDPTHRPALLTEKLKSEFEIRLADAQPSNGGYDFPLFRLDPPIDMVSSDKSNENAKSAVSEESATLRGLKPAPNTEPPISSEPAKLIPQ